jgi:hypothetical protein
MKKEGKKYIVSMSGPEIAPVPKNFHLDSLFGFNQTETEASTDDDYFLYYTKINVRIDSTPTEDDFDFDKKYFTYFKALSPQCLIIDTSAIKEISVVKKMKIIVKDNEAKKYIKKISYDNKTSKPAEVELEEVFSSDANFIHIFFDIPKKTDYFSFVLGLVNQDVKIQDWECDPQVGHDPPQIKP